MRCPSGCESRLPRAPLPVDNPPGQPVLQARIGTFASFRRAMLEALAARSELAGLTTRESDDHTVAVVEQWAAVADVLTFYTERYLADAFLGTATGDAALHRLVRLIGYRPRPGVSATTTLTVRLLEGSAQTLAAGFRVQSVPGPDETPQDFETLADLAADWRLNDLPARPPRVIGTPLSSADGALVDLAAAPSYAGLTAGEPVLLVTRGTVVHAALAAVETDGERLRLRFTATLPAGTGSGGLYRPARSLRLFGWDAPPTSPPAATPDATVPGGVRWTLGSATAYGLAAGATLTLDRQYDDLAAGTSLLVHVPRVVTAVATIVGTAVVTATLAGRSAAVTRVTLDTSLPELADRRAVEVVELIGRAVPLSPSVDAAAFDGEVWVPGVATTTEDGARAVRVALPLGAPPAAAAPVLRPADVADGRTVVLADAAGTAVVTSVRGDARLSPASPADGQEVHLVVPVAAASDELASLDLATTRLLGNAVAASHGATVAEAPGTGDGALAFQRFRLVKAPLTRVPAATSQGSVPALTVRVDGLAWPVVPELLAAGPSDEVVTLRTEADGTTVVQFGDGEHGARPRTGAVITADYRHGAGLAGRVGAGTLTNAASKPAGVDRVTNPVPAEGGGDPEASDLLRERAPASVRLLGRAVSAADCAELLVTTGQVAKAQAAEVWDGRGPVIAITVLGEAGGTFGPSLLTTLADTVKAAGPPYRRVVVGNHVPVPVTVSMNVIVDPRAVTDTVLAGVRAAVLARFAAGAAALGRHFPLSEIYRVAEAVAGVEAVVVTAFAYRRPARTAGRAWAAFLAAHGAGTEATPEWLRFLGVRTTPAGAILDAESPTLAGADLAVTAAFTAGGAA